MISYVVLVKIGPYEFGKRFHDQEAALECFDCIAEDQNGEVHGGHLVKPANALVDRVEFQIHNNELENVGNPNRRR